MPYLNNYGNRYNRFRSNAGSVRVGRAYVFSNVQRPGFYPMQTRNGLVYAKRRRY